MGIPAEVAIVGCGNRGRVYAKHATNSSDKIKITAVADPNEFRVKMAGDMFGVPDENRFRSCDEFLASGIRVDAVINATMDRDHYDTSIKILNAGFDMLVEKPICLTKQELLDIYEAAVTNKCRVMVCHVLRYAPFYAEIKRRILAGEIGRIYSMVTEENVSFHHFATAFVRGKWGNSDMCGSQIMMAKCCHDLDIIAWLKNDSVPVYVSSMGGLYNYIEENFPKGASDICTEGCMHSDHCEYDAEKMYVTEGLWHYYSHEFLDDYEDRDSDERLLWSLSNGNPYGKCVWKSGNNVNDHQTVTIEFADGCVVSHNLIGGTPKADRTIHIAGTKGEIYGSIEGNYFYIRKPDLSNPKRYTEEKIDLDATGDGHGGGDERLSADFVEFITGGETSVSRTELQDSIYGHLIGFGAHEAMTGKKVVKIERL
ncbi:MAG: Gfo/Idh/MocA family oxidoreductase [Clostridia bacterium]|nr:Gfo/Idh/MocA family oxidoreductase [Clostridia bacterium]